METSVQTKKTKKTVEGGCKNTEKEERSSEPWFALANGAAVHLFETVCQSVHGPDLQGTAVSRWLTTDASVRPL